LIFLLADDRVALWHCSFLERTKDHQEASLDHQNNTINSQRFPKSMNEQEIFVMPPNLCTIHSFHKHDWHIHVLKNLPENSIRRSFNATKLWMLKITNNVRTWFLVFFSVNELPWGKWYSWESMDGCFFIGLFWVFSRAFQSFLEAFFFQFLYPNFTIKF
jgi:hypothetical protein